MNQRTNSLYRKESINKPIPLSAEMDKPRVALCHPLFVTDVKQSSIRRIYLAREMIVQSQALVENHR